MSHTSNESSFIDDGSFAGTPRVANSPFLLVGEYKRKLEEVQHENFTLKMKYQGQKKKYKELMVTINSLRIENERIRKELGDRESREATVLQEASHHLESEAVSSFQIVELQTRLENMELENKQLIESRDRALADKDTIANSFKSLKVEYDNMKNAQDGSVQNSSLFPSNSLFGNENGGFSNLGELIVAFEAATNANDELSKENSLLQIEVKRLLSENEQLQNESQSSANLCDQLVSSLDNHKMLLGKKEEEFEVLKKEYIQSNEKSQNVEKEIRRELEMLHAQLNENISELDDLRENNNEMKDNNAVLEESNKEKDKINHDLETELLTTNQRLNDLSNENEKLKLDLNESLKNNQELGKTLNNLKSKFENQQKVFQNQLRDKENEINLTKELLNQFRGENQQLLLEIEDLKNQINDLEQPIKMPTKTSIGASPIIKHDEEIVNLKSKQKELLNTYENKINTILKDKANEIKELNSKILTLIDEKDSIQSLLSATTDELRILKEKSMKTVSISPFNKEGSEILTPKTSVVSPLLFSSQRLISNEDSLKKQILRLQEENLKLQSTISEINNKSEGERDDEILYLQDEIGKLTTLNMKLKKDISMITKKCNNLELSSKNSRNLLKLKMEKFFGQITKMVLLINERYSSEVDRVFNLFRFAFGSFSKDILLLRTSVGNLFSSYKSAIKDVYIPETKKRLFLAQKNYKDNSNHVSQTKNLNSNINQAEYAKLIALLQVFIDNLYQNSKESVEPIPKLAGVSFSRLEIIIKKALHIYQRQISSFMEEILVLNQQLTLKLTSVSSSSISPSVIGLVEIVRKSCNTMRKQLGKEHKELIMILDGKDESYSCLSPASIKN